MPHWLGLDISSGNVATGFGPVKDSQQCFAVDHWAISRSIVGCREQLGDIQGRHSHPLHYLAQTQTFNLITVAAMRINAAVVTGLLGDCYGNDVGFRICRTFIFSNRQAKPMTGRRLDHTRS